MAKDLTALAIEKMKPAAARREIPDGRIRGLYFVVQPSGARSWAYRYRAADGRSRKLTLGAYPNLSLEAARRLAAKAAMEAAEGADPAADKARARAAARQPKDHELVEVVVARFLERHARPKTREATFKESARILDREIVSRWRGRPLSAIRKADIHAVLDAIVDRGAPSAANRSLEAIRPMFRWAVERDIIAISPCDGIVPPSPKVQRDRVLDDEELSAIWSVAERLGNPFGPIVQLLMLTGQRRDEVGGMRRDELDLDAGLWTLPPARAKNKREHVVPLPPLARQIIEVLPAVEGQGGYLFTTTGKGPVSGFGKAKERIDRLLLEARPGMPAWVLHDFRRSVATGCARLGFPPQVVEAILNHRAGTIRGVARVYNKYDHASEKRQALEAWARHVESLVSPQVSNVLPLKAARP